MKLPDYPLDTHDQISEALHDLDEQAVALVQSGEATKAVVGIQVHDAIGHIFAELKYAKTSEDIAVARMAVSEFRALIQEVASESPADSEESFIPPHESMDSSPRASAM
jgi:hypothetical protein